MISVIVPVYNVEPYLRKCLDSIVSQTYQDLEILVIDDGSTDGSGKICDEYKRDQRVRVFHTENAGLSAARNLGLDKAHGEWIEFIDSDDWVEPDYCRIPLELAESHKAYLAVSTNNTSAIRAYEKVGFVTEYDSSFIRVLKVNIPYKQL
jgi:glycosyltransferase involved in cell wall biosynthesis